ncbi:MAG TPA: glycoside hydrolase family 38 C-terminal domain-containing protein [Chthoniobacterales bacterium]|nr:glycoside hydrolase family 38 C-terminal domain-containing protein [Chthoniobacterales bacterium]
MEIRRDTIQQSLRRLSNRLLEFGAWRDREWILIADGEFRVDPDAPWRPIRSGDPWPIQPAPVEFRFEVSIPKRWAGYPVRCRFRLGGEALLFVDGLPVAGLNPFHDEHPVLSSATGGETLHFEAQAVSHGLFGTPTEPRIEFAAVLIPESGVRSLYHDLAAALDGARYHYFAGRPAITESILEAIHRAFARISLPRSETEEYLARFATTSQNRSAENFYGNEESLVSLWERWEFRSPTSSLTVEQLQQLREVREQFVEELRLIRIRFPVEGGLWLTGHAHIDLAWLWPLEETRRKARRTFHTVLGLMDRYPELYFNQSSAQLYAWIERDDPALFEKIQTHVRTGRWELVGGMWVEPDGNLPAGESWVRQLLLGQRYFESRFGQRARVAWLPDSFGFTGALPQLLVSAGIPYFFTHKLTWNERNPFPYDLYWWEGIDGSRVLAHSFANPDSGYNARVTAQEVGETWRNFSGKKINDFSLLAFGHGDGGGGPSEEMLERFARLSEFPGMPRLKIGPVTDFYDKISTPSLPVWVGEQYLEYHRATFTTQGRVKSLHRRLERALVETETAATLAYIWYRRPYPVEELRLLWQTLLLNEFHDILPGSSIHSVYEVAHRQLISALDETMRLREDALVSVVKGNARDVGSSSAEEGLVWNLQLHDRPLFVEVADVADRERISANGRELVTQRLEDNRMLVAAADLIVPALSAVPLRSMPGEPAAILSPIRVSRREIENENLRLRVDGDGSLASVYDKIYGREILADRGNQIWLFTDIPRQFDAWDIDVSYPDEGLEVVAEREPEIVEQGPLRAALRVVRRHDNIEIVQDYRLATRSRVLEICTRVRWRGRRRFLRAVFPFEIRTHEVWAETAFGAVARPNHRNTPWDQARFEVPAHRWVDLSEPSYGVSLLNNGKYGYSAQGNVLGISLLRSPIYPDPYADEGDHEFVYAIYPHGGDWRNGTVQAAEDMHCPLTVTPAAETPVHPSLFRFKANSLKFACLKKAEDSDDVILRLYEPYGNRGQTTLETALPLRKAAIVNILEEQADALVVEDEQRISVSFTPFQVISLRLTFAPAN